MSGNQRAVDLREALLAETLDEIARLHDAVRSLGPTLHAAVAEAVAAGKKEVADHAQAQVMFVEQAMLKDREKFVQEQKALLEDLGQQLKNRDTWLTALMAEILKKGRQQYTEEMEQAAMKARTAIKKQERKILGGIFLGVLLTVIGAMLGVWMKTSAMCGQ